MGNKKEECENENIIIIDESSLNPKDEKSQLTYTQAEAYKDLSNFLTESLQEKRNKKFNRKHNTIFVNGKRGSGKTQFLLSIKKFIQKEDKKFKKLYFFNPIDPTLLHDNENFLTIIIAMILNDLNKKSKLKNLPSIEQKYFYDLLSKLSKAIDGTINNKNNDRSSLENIAQDQSSLQLEKYINEFFYLVLKISNKQKLVILIDDIDMALDKGFEVLEVIRKYLSSSHVIPIVTGDIDLYKLLVENYFLSSLKKDFFPTQRIYSPNHSSEENIRSILVSSAQDYLIKVFPMHRRIKIKTFWELAENKTIKFNFNQYEHKFCRKKDTINFDITFDSTIEDFKAELTENLFNLSARIIIQIFKRELTDNPEEFLTNIENIKKIHSHYNYEILSTQNMIKKYKKLIDDDMIERKFSNAKTTLEKAIKVENEDYQLFDSLGRVNYEIIVTKNFYKEDFYKENKEILKLYKESIQAYTTSIELYNQKQRYDLRSIQKDEHIIQRIENDLAYSYLELLEYLLINNLKDEYDKEAERFLLYFDRNSNYLKVFDMFDILFSLTEKSPNDIQDSFQEWENTYKRVNISWSFQKLNQWKNRLNNNNLQDYIQEFEWNFYPSRRIHRI